MPTLDPTTEDLRARLTEAEQTLAAIRGGEVDALLVQTPEGERVYTLKGAERPYRLLIEEMQEGAATVSSDGAILYCNRRFAEMLQVPLERLIGSRLVAHVREEDRPRVEEVVRQAQARAGRVECAMVREPGGTVPARLTASPLPSDMPDCVCVIAADITQELRTQELLDARGALRESDDRLRAALKELEAHRDRLEALVEERTVALRESHERLRHSERMAALGTLAAGLGHDVSNTILPLRVRLEMLARAPELTPDSREHLDVVQGFADYLTSLARGLRQFARDPEHAEGEARTNLGAWQADVARFLVASVDPSITVSVSVASDLPEIPLAPHRLTQAILNLVHNARDAITVARSGPGAGLLNGHPARIDISATREDSGVAISVEDNGCGMSDEVRARCFEPFYTTKARGHGGTGLGLSMVFGIAGRAGGRVDLASRAGEGTTIKLWFPGAGADASGRASKRASHVTLEDPRMKGIVSAMLRSMDQDVVTNAPKTGPGGSASLWVTDSRSATPQQAERFLRGDPSHRVVVLGGDEAWSRSGATVQPGRPRAEDLRRALSDACGG
jgi:PAS domain S-box-containing protein